MSQENLKFRKIVSYSKTFLKIIFFELFFCHYSYNHRNIFMAYSKNKNFNFFFWCFFLNFFLAFL